MPVHHAWAGPGRQDGWKGSGEGRAVDEVASAAIGGPGHGEEDVRPQGMFLFFFSFFLVLLSSDVGIEPVLSRGGTRAAGLHSVADRGFWLRIWSLKIFIYN